MNTKEILQMIEEHQEEALDEETLVGNLEYHERGYINNNAKVMDLSISDHAENQLLTRLGIPTLYKKRCPFWLAQTNFNYWRDKHKEKQLKLRLLIRDSKYYCRAVMTPRYVPMDNYQVVPLIIQELENFQRNNDIEFNYEWTPDFCMIRAHYKHLSVEQGDLRVQALVSISNSETGMASLKIQPSLRIPTYPWSRVTDLYVSDKNREGVTSIRHLKEFSSERVREAIRKAIEVAQVGAARALVANQEQVQAPLEVIENFVYHNPLVPKLVLEILEDEWKEKAFASKLQIGAAILDALQTLPLFARHQAECEVGRYLNLFQNSSRRLGGVLANIMRVKDNKGVNYEEILEGENNESHGES